MSTYHGRFRTNYFHVTDMEKFKNIMSRVVANVFFEVFSRSPHSPQKSTDVADVSVGFGGGCALLGVVNTTQREINDSFQCQPIEQAGWDESSQEADFDQMVSELQDILPDNEAIIIMSSGYENLRYMVGEALIITNNNCKHISVSDVAKTEASRMLGMDWDTCLEY